MISETTVVTENAGAECPARVRVDNDEISVVLIVENDEGYHAEFRMDWRNTKKLVHQLKAGLKGIKDWGEFWADECAAMQQ